MMKNTFYFVLSALFVLKILIFLLRLFDKKAKVNFKFYDITNWETNNYNTHIAQYLKK